MAEHRNAILIFSHDEELRKALRIEANFFGLEASLTGNEEAAIGLLLSRRYAAVFSSALEPLFEGLRLMPRLKKMNIDLPHLLILGPSSKIDRAQAQTSGFAAVLLFPFRKADVQDALKRILGPRRPRDTKHERQKSSLEIRYGFSETDKGHVGLLVDVSHGGARIKISVRHLNVGDRIFFSVKNDDGTVTLEGTALVRWMCIEMGDEDSYTFGIKFLYLIPELTLKCAHG